MNHTAKLSAVLPALSGRLALASGTCAQHGESSVLVRTGMAWHCSHCLERKLAQEGREHLLQERIDTLHKIARFPPRHAGKKFISRTPQQRECREVVAAFRDFIVANREWAALVLIGANGTGKSLLATEFGERYIANFSRSARYTTAHCMIAEIQSSYGRDGKSEENEIERFVQFDLLIIDEIDAKRDTESANLLLTEVIGRRYNANKPVVVISNQPLASLSRFIGDRICDRLRENSYVCALNWPSYRGTV